MKGSALRQAGRPLPRSRRDNQPEARRAQRAAPDPTTPSARSQLTMSLPAGPSGEVASVMWREGTWRCDFCNVPGRPVFQLYDREILELEQCVAEDNFTAISEMMREAVRRLVAATEGQGSGR
jgi:hypothetical protein